MELMPDYQPRVVRFSVFEVDLRVGELRRNGIKAKLQNQPFQILAMLLECPISFEIAAIRCSSSYMPREEKKSGVLCSRR